MPLFDFHCAACNHTFEVELPFGSKQRPSCSECGSTKTEKLLSPPPVIFKGAGFYKTDAAGTSPAKKEKQKDGEKEKPQSKKEEKNAKQNTQKTTNKGVAPSSDAP